MSISKIIFPIVLMVLSGCGGGNSEVNEENSGDILFGKWASCDFDGDAGLLETYVFNNGEWTFTEDMYEDESCEVLIEGHGETRTGSYILGNEIVTSSGFTATEVKLSHSSGDVCYQIIEVVQDTLYWGLIADFETECDTPETQPVEFDYRYSFHKAYD